MRTVRFNVLAYATVDGDGMVGDAIVEAVQRVMAKPDLLRRFVDVGPDYSLFDGAVHIDRVFELSDENGANVATESFSVRVKATMHEEKIGDDYRDNLDEANKTRVDLLRKIAA